MLAFRAANKNDVAAVRKIAKSHGVKCCRLLNKEIFIGKQTEEISQSVAIALVADLKENGYMSLEQETIDSLIAKDILSGFSVMALA